MIYVNLVDGIAVSVVPADAPYAEKNKEGVQSRRDWNNFQQVEKIANELTAATGVEYLPADRGEYTSPRFDIFKAPQVGDEISRGFNGDYYPCGTISKITANGRFIFSTDGKKFIRQGKSSSYRQNTGTFWMVAGVHNERNPHF